jgi:hypothetical protein
VRRGPRCRVDQRTRGLLLVVCQTILVHHDCSERSDLILIVHTESLEELSLPLQPRGVHVLVVVARVRARPGSRRRVAPRALVAVPAVDGECVGVAVEDGAAEVGAAVETGDFAC